MRRTLLVLMVLVFPLSGCVWKSDHLKKVKDLEGRIIDLVKLNKELKAALSDRSGKLAQMTSDRDRLARLRQMLEQKLAEVSSKHNGCRRDLASLASTKGQLGARLQKALDRVRRLEEIARRRKAIFDKLRLSFKSMVAAGKLRVKMVEGMLVLQLAEKILFATGRWDLKREGKEAISQVAQILKGMNRRWQVAGHTDTVGRPAYNWRLSTRRALAVLKEMLKHGMPPKLVSAAGFGQYQPTAKNDTRDNKALNRRTEIMLVPDLRELRLGG